MKTEPDNLEEVKAAHARGEIIQFRERGASHKEWYVYGDPRSWWDGYDYRVAPKPENVPWHVMPSEPESRENCIQPLFIVDADGNFVVRVTEGTHASADALRRAYAAHIVRCVNAVPQAIAALEGLMRRFRDDHNNPEEYPDYEEARAALAALKGE